MLQWIHNKKIIFYMVLFYFYSNKTKDKKILINVYLEKLKINKSTLKINYLFLLETIFWKFLYLKVERSHCHDKKINIYFESEM